MNHALAKKGVLSIFFSMLSLLLGCASSTDAVQRETYLSRAEKAISEEKWDVAYRFLEDEFKSSIPERRKRSRDLYYSHAQLQPAANSTFSPDNIRKTLSLHGAETGNSIEENRITLFSNVASQKEIEKAKENLGIAIQPFQSLISKNQRIRALRNEINGRIASGEKGAANLYGNDVYVVRSIFSILKNSDQTKLLEENPLLTVVPDDNVGRITTVQIINRSTSGTDYGTRLGSALGQATYIDNSTWRGYSATSQLAAGLVGGLIGSSLDTKATTRFQINYGIASFSGEIQQSINNTNDESALPVGMCIWLRDFTQAPLNLCADSLPNFLKRLRGNINNSTEAQATTPKISLVACETPSLGTLLLTKSDCNEIGGTEK